MRALIGRFAPKPVKRAYRRIRGINDPNAMWDRIHAMRTRYQRRNRVSPSPRSQKVLFNSQFGWPYGIVEYTVASALLARGHDVNMIACGGLPKYCELITATQERPPCSQCHANLAMRLDSFGLPHAAMVDYLSDSDREEALGIAESTPINELRGLVEDGVPVGQLAFFNHFQYYKGYPFSLEGSTGEVFRDALSSAILVTRAAARILDDYRPDVLCTTNGKFLQWSPFLYQAVKRNIPYVTWEDYQIRPASVAFASNEIAHETRQSAVWRAEIEKPLNDLEHRALREHFRLWSAGEVTSWAGYAASGKDESRALQALLNLRDGRPVVALFPNLSWDASSVGFETAFSSMYEWLYRAVEYAARRPDVEFVIRAHPAEARLPDHLRPPIPVCEAVRRNCQVVPSNVHLVEGHEAVNSYALASLASVNMVYTSTLGIELPLRGIRPWVAAGPYYAGKGFTVDLKSADHMFALLDSDTFVNTLDEAQVARAERFAYLVRFRGLFDFPLMPAAGEFSATDWSELGPDGNAVLDAICEKLLNREPFIDLESTDVLAHSA